MAAKRVDRKKLGKEYRKIFDEVVDYVERENSLGKRKGKSVNIDSFQHRILFDIISCIENSVERVNGDSGISVNGNDRRRSVRIICEGIFRRL